MMKFKSKIKNFALKVIVALNVVSVFVSIGMIENGEFLAVIPFGLSIGFLALFAWVNRFTRDYEEYEEYDEYEEYEEEYEEKRKSA